MKRNEITNSQKGLEGEVVSGHVMEPVGQAVPDASIEWGALPPPEKQSMSDSSDLVVEEQSCLRYSSALEFCQSKDVSSSPRRCLEHWNTAPEAGETDLLLERQESMLFRSKTDKKETSKHELKLDRLSEREKKKLIVNLVKIQNDGTVEVDVTRSAPVASELLELNAVDQIPTDVDETTIEFNRSIPRLRIAILVVGTRGDVQPFLAMAKRLQEYGHHVRLATHANFRAFVRSAGIDFYPLGGDPRVFGRIYGEK